MYNRITQSGMGVFILFMALIAAKFGTHATWPILKAIDITGMAKKGQKVVVFLSIV